MRRTEMENPKFIEARVERGETDPDCEVCGGGIEPPYVIEGAHPAGEVFSLSQEIERNGFLPGELVAIIRLGDLLRLLALADNYEAVSAHLEEMRRLSLAGAR